MEKSKKIETLRVVTFNADYKAGKDGKDGKTVRYKKGEVHAMHETVAARVQEKMGKDVKVEKLTEEELIKRFGGAKVDKADIEE